MSASDVDPNIIDEWMRWASIFDLWDLDGDGRIDHNEINQGVQYFLDMNGVNFTMFEARTIMDDIAPNSARGGSLDRQEFGCFLSKLASTVGLPLEALAKSLADQQELCGERQAQAAGVVQIRSWHTIPTLFDAWDADKDGSISRHELSKGIRKFRGVAKMRITLADCLALMDAVDIDGDMQLDPIEFGAFLSRFSLAAGIPMNEIVDFFLSESSSGYRERRQSLQVDAAHSGWQMMPNLFDTWDSDNSGTIDRSELTSGMGRLIEDNGLQITLQHCYTIMVEVDLNNDKELDRREFGCFLSRFAVAADVSLDEVTYYLMKQREGQQPRRSSTETRNLEKGWTDMPRLFRMWDKDKSGYLDREEVAVGINKFRNAKRCKISLAESLLLMDEVDMDGNRVLDQMEFGAFLSRFSFATGVELSELTDFLMAEYNEQVAPKRQGLFGSFFAKANIGLAEESADTLNKAQ